MVVILILEKPVLEETRFQLPPPGIPDATRWHLSWDVSPEPFPHQVLEPWA